MDLENNATKRAYWALCTTMHQAVCRAGDLLGEPHLATPFDPEYHLTHAAIVDEQGALIGVEARRILTLTMGRTKNSLAGNEGDRRPLTFDTDPTVLSTANAIKSMIQGDPSSPPNG